GAYDHLQSLAEAGVGCIKIEGRKKKPEYVATVTRAYREFLDRVEQGTFEPPRIEETEPLVQIFSRGFTGGMFGGREGREYITRTHPDNHGLDIGVVVESRSGEIVIEVRYAVNEGDGLGFEPAAGAAPSETVGFSVRSVRTVAEGPPLRQSLAAPKPVPVGWRVVRTADVELLAGARGSFASVQTPAAESRKALRVRAFGNAGGPLKLAFTTEGDTEIVESVEPLRPATAHPLGEPKLREQLGRLGGTPFALTSVDVRALGSGLFIPVSELNRMRQAAVAALAERRGWSAAERRAARATQIAGSIRLPDTPGQAVAGRDGAVRPDADTPRLVAEVCRIDDARAAADAGATEVVLDPFIRHPTPPRARVLALREELAARGVPLRLRTPSVVRPDDRRSIEPWLATGLPLLTGHLGILADAGATGRDVVADYATNCFNPHTARELFRLGAKRITPSVELTAEEMKEMVAPWNGADFEVLIYGRPEGMTIEHCVLSAAFDREPTTCRDLCVKSHPNVELTDPTGYVFPVATDSDCRNRLLHSRPIDGSEFVGDLWAAGIRAFRLVFNVPGDRVGDITGAFRHLVDSLAAGAGADPSAVRNVVGREYTRGHFERAV
ncbi:MAG: DUF3656 domain-containing protein, partial [Gemmatimonadota bacterium]|nr:DUF3656 domain-containing protein [Gemmatimonadota bacterium]